jgi:hypothetical protein
LNRSHPSCSSIITGFYVFFPGFPFDFCGFDAFFSTFETGVQPQPQFLNSLFILDHLLSSGLEPEAPRDVIFRLALNLVNTQLLKYNVKKMTESPATGISIAAS